MYEIVIPYEMTAMVLVVFCSISFIGSGQSYDYHNATEAILKYMGQQVIQVSHKQVIIT